MAWHNEFLSRQSTIHVLRMMNIFVLVVSCCRCHLVWCRAGWHMWCGGPVKWAASTRGCWKEGSYGHCGYCGCSPRLHCPKLEFVDLTVYSSVQASLWSPLSLSPRLSGHRVVVDHGFGRRANDLVFGTVVAFLCGCDCDHLSCWWAWSLLFLCWTYFTLHATGFGNGPCLVLIDRIHPCLFSDFDLLVDVIK
jgi:hypothetical protein